MCNSSFSINGMEGISLWRPYLFRKAGGSVNKHNWHDCPWYERHSQDLQSGEKAFLLSVKQRRSSCCSAFWCQGRKGWWQSQPVGTSAARWSEPSIFSSRAKRSPVQSSHLYEDFTRVVQSGIRRNRRLKLSRLTKTYFDIFPRVYTLRSREICRAEQSKTCIYCILFNNARAKKQNSCPKQPKV